LNGRLLRICVVQVSLRFVPFGYQWASSTAVILSAGYSSHSAGIGGPQLLPSTLSLANANTKTILKVHIERELDWGLSDEPSKDLDPGAEIAMGCPMLARLYIPYWVLNLTQVPISIAIVERQRQQTLGMAAARQLAYGSDKSRGAEKVTAGRASQIAALKLDTIECTKAQGIPPPSNPASQCQVLPGTCELLSHSSAESSSESPSEVVVQVQALGAPWSPGLVLMMSSEDEGGTRRSDAIFMASESLREGRPVLIRAHVPENGMVLDIVAHLQVSTPVGGYVRACVWQLECVQGTLCACKFA
jgi:hypothetical protein